MALRDEAMEAMKASMKAGDAARTSTLRMILAKVKDADIAARPKGITAVPDDEIMSLLRGMVKSRRESIVLYEQGHRPELAAKEAAEIAVIEGFLPQAMDERALVAAVDAAVTSTGARSILRVSQPEYGLDRAIARHTAVISSVASTGDDERGGMRRRLTSANAMIWPRARSRVRSVRRRRPPLGRSSPVAKVRAFAVRCMFSASMSSLSRSAGVTAPRPTVSNSSLAGFIDLPIMSFSAPPEWLREMDIARTVDTYKYLLFALC